MKSIRRRNHPGRLFFSTIKKLLHCILIKSATQWRGSQVPGQFLHLVNGSSVSNPFNRSRSPTPSRHSSSYRRSSSYSHHGGPASFYKRRPRDGYIQRMVYQVKKILRNLYSYARRHPVKVFMLIIMPLITGGALHNILRQFGIRLPGGLSSMMSEFGSSRGGLSSPISSFGGRGGEAGIQNIMEIAKMFM